MKKILGLAGAIALSIIPTPSFSGEVEQKEMMSVTEQLLPQIGEKYKNLDIKEKKAYKEALINYLEDVQKTGATGVGEGFGACFAGVLAAVEATDTSAGAGTGAGAAGTPRATVESSLFTDETMKLILSNNIM